MGRGGQNSKDQAISLEKAPSSKDPHISLEIAPPPTLEIAQGGWGGPNSKDTHISLKIAPSGGRGSKV